MNTGSMEKDLVVLVADKNIAFTVQGLLQRTESLKMKKISYDIYSHPQHDPGCYQRSHLFLKSYLDSHAHALVLFDRLGCGSESSREELERESERVLFQSGWRDRAATIVIDPTLENWVWSDSPHVDSLTGWDGKNPNLRTWLTQQGHLKSGQSKPSQPKIALEEALRKVGKQRSSVLFRKLAQKVSLERCSDPAFGKFKRVLEEWFPFRKGN